MSEIEQAPLDVFQLLERQDVKEKLRLLVPTHVDVGRYAVSIENYLRLSTNEALLACTPKSVIRAIFTAASLDLEVDGKQHAYLIPYKSQCQLIPGFRGYLAKMQGNPLVRNVETRVVYEGDEFEAFGGTSPGIKHVMNTKIERQLDKITHWYVILHYKNGAFDFEYMDRSQVDAIKEKALENKKGKGKFIWENYYDEMGRKTVVRRFAKRLQLPTVAQLLQIDEGHEQGRIVNVEGDQIIQEDNPDVEIVNDPKENTQIIKSLLDMVADPENRVKGTTVKDFSIAYFSEDNVNNLTTKQLRELKDAIKKEFRIP